MIKGRYGVIKIQKVVLALFLIVFLFSIFSCSNKSNLTEGGTSETENTLVGKVNQAGDPVSDVTVKLYPNDYNPLTDTPLEKKHVTTTEENGSYTFSNIPIGEYMLVAESNSENKKAILPFFVSGSGDIEIEDLSLESPGYIILSLEDYSEINEEGHLYIPGTDLSIEITQSDIQKNVVQFVDVPINSFSEIIFINKQDSIPVNVVNDSQTIIPLDSMVAALTQWKYKRKVVFNTSMSGAGISQNLYNYPLLVRLDSGDVDFSLILTGGTELLFTNKNGEILIYEIEEWDSINSSAIIWVKVDTIQANNDSQYITLHYGNSENEVNMGSNVFETSKGFVGVWHLHQDPKGNIAKSTIDQTTNGLHGTPDGFDTTQGLIDAVLGKGILFDGKNDEIQLPNYPLNETITISVWSRMDIVDPGFRHIFSRHPDWFISGEGEQQLIRFAVNSYDSLKSNWTWSSFDSTMNLGIGDWHHYVGVYNGTELKSYLDGELVDSKISNTPGKINLQGETRIGNYWNDSIPGVHAWLGGIDEVRLMNKAMNSDWIKMDYQNQRRGSTVIKIINPD